ncbi:sterol carrier family protein [Pseudoclavibacter helvolus]|uniref:sterol carrier family protein n=1 Tax=Pseudoclavibacter helvolus TaxID=255205 RepID=UPI003C70CF3B
MPKPRIADTTGLDAITVWAEAHSEGRPTPRTDAATAVRYTLQALEDRAPGASVEVRVPPFGAVQCVEGPGHTRGTPPNVIELDADTWLELATGRTTWRAAVDANRVRASGTRADVSTWLPLVRR